jgi:hypothetical protein
VSPNLFTVFIGIGRLGGEVFLMAAPAVRCFDHPLDLFGKKLTDPELISSWISSPQPNRKT